MTKVGVNYDEMTARVLIQSIFIDIDSLKIRKRQKDKILEFLKSISHDPLRYLKLQQNRFSYEKPNILGTRQDD